MKTGIACLVAAYVLSQFYRAFLAVLAPVLKTDLGATAEDLATASGIWFLAFAAAQLPVGWALDRVGPRLTAVALLACGGAGGAAVFAMAQTPGAIMLAMALIGVGCAPVLMAAYYIFARQFPPAVFATLASVTVGIGSLGNIAGSLPLARAVDLFGWRETLWAMAAITLAVSLLILVLTRDPARLAGGAKGSLLDLLRLPALWPVFVMMAVCYLAAGALRGLWVGPYYADVFGADTQAVGRAALVMGLAMVAGNFAYGPLDRMLRTRKWVIFWGNLISALCLIALGLWPAAGGWITLALLSAVGFFGATFAMVIAHGRAFIPPHLVGRGVTLLNLFGIGAVGIAQFLSGRLHAAIPPDPPAAPYGGLFLAFGLTILVGCLIYLRAEDRID